MRLLTGLSSICLADYAVGLVPVRLLELAKLRQVHAPILAVLTLFMGGVQGQVIAYNALPGWSKDSQQPANHPAALGSIRKLKAEAVIAHWRKVSGGAAVGRFFGSKIAFWVCHESALAHGRRVGHPACPAGAAR
jgi:hypothetical protein